MRLAGLVFCLLATAFQPAQAQEKWIGSWGAAPTPPATAPGSAWRSPTFSNQTISQVVRLTAGGSRIRLRFTNAYGDRPLEIGSAQIALLDANDTVILGSERILAFSGSRAVSVPAGAPMLSDAISLATRPLARLRVSIYLPGDTGPCTCHRFGQATLSIVDGDALGQPGAPTDDPQRIWAYVSGVEVATLDPARVIVAFGDSITDGVGATPGKGWPDRLFERLRDAYPARTLTVVNAGIGGNRLLADGFDPSMGQSALARFDRDVLSVSGASDVIILEGINDLNLTKPIPSTEELVLAYRQLIGRAHARGLRIIGATILPYAGSQWHTPDGEAVRQGLNRWIRTSQEFDAVVDFDAVIRNPAKPEMPRNDLLSDTIHPNDAGYRLMGDAIDLELFR